MKRMSLLLALLCSTCFGQVSYPIVYCRTPQANRKHFDPRAKSTPLQDAVNPNSYIPGTDLMIWRPGKGSEVLVSAGDGCIQDPQRSFDGQWIYYMRVRDFNPNDMARFPSQGSDLYRVHVATKRVEKVLDFGGKIASGPCPLPNGRIMFAGETNYLHPKMGRSRNGLIRSLQTALYVCDTDGKNLEKVGHHNLQAVLHPMVLTDGRVQYATHEAHGLRNERAWSIWAINPDGRKWSPLFSHLTRDLELNTLHGQAQLSDGRLLVIEYYPSKNEGFGTLIAYPNNPKFGSPDRRNNPVIKDAGRGIQYGFQPVGAKSLTPWVTSIDQLNGSEWKVAWPSAAPGNQVLLAAGRFEQPGNGTTFRMVDCGIYLHGSEPSTSFSGLTKIVDSPDYLEYAPIAVVPYKRVYGIDEPLKRPWLPATSADPTGFFGTSSVFVRESARVRSKFRALAKGISDRWGQGGDTIPDLKNDQIHRVRILTQYGSKHDFRGFRVYGGERLLVLGDIPIASDGSCLGKLPADTSFIPVLIDKQGRVLTHSFTWHQLRPGETRTDCAGCHAHEKPDPTPFKLTIAGQPKYKFTDLSNATSRQYGYRKDVLPILKKHGIPEGDILDDTKPTAIPYHAILSDVLIDNADKLSPDEFATIAAWIDTGKPLDTGGKLFSDEKEPTLFLREPKREQASFTRIQIGSLDTQSGIASVIAFVNGRPIELKQSGFTYSAEVPETTGEWQVRVVSTDTAGNRAEVIRTFRGDALPTDPDADRIRELEAEVASLKERLRQIHELSK